MSLEGKGRARLDVSRREDSVVVEAETGVMWPQGKERLEPPEAGRQAWYKSSLRASQRNQPFQHFDLLVS